MIGRHITSWLINELIKYASLSPARHACDQGDARDDPRIVRGYEMYRQWVDGDQVCSIYEFKIETPLGAGSIPMAEWSVVRDGQLVSSRLLFDTATMAALIPAG